MRRQTALQRAIRVGFDDGADALVVCGNDASGLGERGPALSRTVGANSEAVADYQNETDGFPASLLKGLFGVDEIEVFG